MTIDAQVADNLAAVTARIERAAREAGRDPAAIGLVAVSKVQPAERVAAALRAGHRLFGENRVQEAQSRWPPFLEQDPDIRLHLIGPLQTNKVKDALALFDVIETLDRPRLATALAREMDRTGRRPDCLIEVNTGEEPQKAGVLPADLDGLYKLAVEECGLPVRGLMAIPPFDDQPAPHFALLAKLAGRYGLPVLSMGMSADFETAIHQGATLVRVGTAIFGERRT
ncbi:MAG: YggS family pyridoxal phosphate-dependent enzyme [Alphaproteobacteria bacterium]|jgi:pyridoxal phosphate enzyme (YggS family)|nr:YggS family pyridoxal phosphate-dependent enzyme [Alphaproteobacteria bacterium]